MRARRRGAPSWLVSEAGSALQTGPAPFDQSREGARGWLILGLLRLPQTARKSLSGMITSTAATKPTRRPTLNPTTRLDSNLIINVFLHPASVTMVAGGFNPGRFPFRSISLRRSPPPATLPYRDRGAPDGPSRRPIVPSARKGQPSAMGKMAGEQGARTVNKRKGDPTCAWPFG